MTKETYIKASKLYHQIAARKGYITSLSQRLYKTRCEIRKAEIEKKIHENVLHLANLRKEFELI